MSIRDGNCTLRNTIPPQCSDMLAAYMRFRHAGTSAPATLKPFDLRNTGWAYYAPFNL